MKDTSKPFTSIQPFNKEKLAYLLNEPILSQLGIQVNVLICNLADIFLHIPYFGDHFFKLSLRFRHRTHPDFSDRMIRMKKKFRIKFSSRSRSLNISFKGTQRRQRFHHEPL